MELNRSIDAKLPTLSVESAEYKHILASETQSKLDFNVALNASLQQKRIYDKLSSVLWEKLVTVSAQMTSFSIFRWQNWIIILNVTITVLNSFVLVVLSLKYKALLLAMCFQKTRAENYIFTINPTTTVATKTAAENAQELWEMIQTAMSEFVGTEILLILIFISIVIFFSFFGTMRNTVACPNKLVLAWISWQQTFALNVLWPT